MIVETGNGFSDANSYVSVVYGDNYFSARGNTAWEELSEETKEMCLIKATDFVDSSFQWRGKKATQEQSLCFPRINLVDDDGYKVEGIPENLKKAVCECASIISTGKEMFSTQNENGAVTSEKIGELAFTYDVAQKIKDTTVYDAINLRLRGLYVDKSKGQILTGGVIRV